MKQSKTMNCIVCPLGCAGTATFDYDKDGEAINIEISGGFSCPRGGKYAIKELTKPERMLTTTVRIRNGSLPLLPVVSNKPLPKAKVMAAATFLSGVTIQAPVSEGQIIYSDVLGLGIDIIASRSMEKI